MGARNKNSRFAVGFTIAGFLLVLISFVSPYWLVYDGKLSNPKFLNLGESIRNSLKIKLIIFIIFILGLWEVCFNRFQDVNRFYDTVFRGCMWVFEEEYYIIHEFLLPGFYIGVQFFYTLCFTLCLIAILLTLVLLKCPRDDDRYVFLLLTNGAVLIFACKYTSLFVYFT